MILTQQAIGIPHFHFNIFQNLWCYVLFFVTLHPYNTYSTWRIDTLTVIGQSWMFIVQQDLVCVSQLSSIFNHRKKHKNDVIVYISIGFVLLTIVIVLSFIVVVLTFTRPSAGF